MKDKYIADLVERIRPLTANEKFREMQASLFLEMAQALNAVNFEAPISGHELSLIRANELKFRIGYLMDYLCTAGDWGRESRLGKLTIELQEILEKLGEIN